MARWPFVPSLDRRLVVTGTHSAGTTTWTLPCSAAGMDCIVLSESFGSDGGKAIVPATASGTTVTASGDYSAGPVYIGRLFPVLLVPSKPIRKDQSDQADLSSHVQLKFMSIAYQNTGSFLVRSRKSLRIDRTKQLESEFDSTVIPNGTLTVFATGKVGDNVISIESLSHKPMTIAGLEYCVDLVGRFR